MFGTGFRPNAPQGVSTMRRLDDRPVTAVAATRPRIARPILLITLLALATALVAVVLARSAATRHAASDAAGPVQVASVDRAAQPWFLPEPTPQIVSKALDQPAKTKAASPEPDWSAFSLGVSDAQASIAVPRTGNESSSPAEIQVAMSRDERSRLISAARDAESGIAPADYRPAIGRLYPGGSGDGICR